MAKRTISAKINNASAGVYFKGTSSAIYGESIIFDSPITVPAKITGGTLRITYAVGYSKTYDAYYDISIGGTYAGRTAAFHDGNQSYHDQVLGLYLPREVFLTGSSNYITITPKRSNGSTDSTIARFNDNSVVTIDINYEYTAISLSTPSNFKASKTSTAPNETVTLSWDSVNDATGNTLNGYQIYRKIPTDTDYKYLTTTTATTYSIQSSSTNNETYYYKIRAIGSAGESYYSPFTNKISITTQYTAPSAPTNVKVNNNSQLYVGTINVPTITLSWNSATQGINNPITRYIIYKNEEQLATTTETSYTLAEEDYIGSFTIVSEGTYGGSKSEASSSAVVSEIGAPASIQFSNTIPSKTGSNIIYTWDPVAVVNNATINYSVSYKVDESNIDLGNIGTSTNYTFDITKINKGKSFTITVTTIATASGGGITTASETSSATIRAGDFTIISGDSFWIKNCDSGSGQETGKYIYSYLTNKLEWAAAEQANESGINFTYTLYQRVNNGNWNQIYNGTKTEYTVNINSINEGSTIGYYVKITDEYNSTLTSSEITTTRLTKPSLSQVKITNITTEEINSQFNWDFTNGSNDTLTYKIYLIYDGKESQYAEGEFNSGSSSREQSNTLTIGLAQGATPSSETMIKALYDRVINQHYAKPKGKLKVDLYSTTYPACLSSSTIDFNFNFITKITSNPTLTLNNTKTTYTNPGDTINYSFTPAVWKDAVGGTTGATISYSITGNNKTISPLTPNTEYTDTAPNAIKDISLTYTLTATVVYADDNSQKVSVSKTIKIARWTQDTVELINVKKDGDTVSGKIVLPENLCSSTILKNLAKIQLSILNQDENELKTFAEITNPYENTKNIDFTFDYTQTEQFYIKVKAIFTNTSNRTIKIFSRSILIRTADISLAIRQGGVGINVKEDFDIEDDGSALSITAKTGANIAPVEQVIMNDSSTSNQIVNYETDTGDILGGILRSGSGISINGVRTIYINSVNPINFFNSNGTSKALLNSIPLENVSGKLNIICPDNDSMIDISRNCTLYVTEDTTNNKINIYAQMYDIPQRNTWQFTIYSYNLN